MSLLSTQAASREYANRPKDERFLTVQALVDHAQHQKDLSVERTYNVKDLHAIADGHTLKLESPKGAARMSHWAFGQFARSIGAPAQYLRDLPSSLAVECMNQGIKQSPLGSRMSLLAQAPNGTPEPTIRAVTTDSYTRVWDADLYGSVAKNLIAHDARWQLPPTWDGPVAGAYRGDRDSFLILVNGGSIVDDPSLRTSNTAIQARRDASTPPDGPVDGMYRGLMIRNSEVGAASITIESILFRYICGNHLLWGAMQDRTFRKAHRSAGLGREAIREILTFAQAHANQSVERDNAIIRTLVDSEIAFSKEAVIDELRKMGATVEQATKAYTTCERTENASPRSFWGIAQGLTRNSQESGFQDERLTLDKLAAKLLQKGARSLVAA